MPENTTAVALPASQIAVTVPDTNQRAARQTSSRRPIVRHALMLIRRSHLYFGLLLVPWALLYGVTGYLFNHPTHFSESNTASFGPSVIAGTAIQKLPAPKTSAQLVVEELHSRFPDEELLKLSDSAPAEYIGEYYFASVQSAGRPVQVLINRNGSGGTVREQPKGASALAGESAPFAIVPRRQEVSAERRATRAAGALDPKHTPLHISQGLDQLAVQSLPTILNRLGIVAKPSGIKVTSAPELEFRVTRDQQDWTVRYNSVTGSVTAQPTSTVSTDISWRKFLTRMHVAHGYPSERNARWFWAIIVDVMSFVMVFWGVSGIMMWWQMKRTRPWGTVALGTSIVAATLLASGMLHSIR